jgi:hypothetical protein
MKYLLMLLGCYSVIVGVYLDSTATTGNFTALLLGSYLGATLIFVAVVVALSGRK